jgi:endonuclease/exonuclease/phosphatase family metal-dependent hydrolase
MHIRRMYLMALIIVIAGCGATVVDPPLKVMSLNIRLDVASDAPNDWQTRKPIIQKAIFDSTYDILGFQEVLKNQYDDLDRMLTGYGHVGVGREDGKDKGEACPIFYRTDRFELLESGTIWLSPNPSDTGRAGWDAALPRIMTWAKLRDKMGDNASGNSGFFFLNTHFDHMGDTARLESAHRIIRFIKEKTGELPVILTGDFNCGPSQPPYAALTSSEILLKDACITVGGIEEATFNGFGRSDENERIDFIFTNYRLEAISYRMLNIKKDSIYISDHYPVTSRIKIMD